jgi:hypothetical protein
MIPPNQPTTDDDRCVVQGCRMRRVINSIDGTPLDVCKKHYVEREAKAERWKRRSHD